MMRSPKEISTFYLDVAESKCATPPVAVLFRAILAGAFVALACVGAQMVSALLDHPGTAKIIGALFFPAGLAMILLVGGELFTGNCMLPLGAGAHRISARQLLISWGLVYLGNALGALVIVALAIPALQTQPAFVAAVRATATHKASLAWMQTFLLGALCNVLVCTGVWMSFAASDATGKIVSMYFPVMLFVLCGMEHCVANVYYFGAALLIGTPGVSIGSFLWGNLLPCTLGNIVGGGVLFSGALWLSLYRS